MEISRRILFEKAAQGNTMANTVLERLEQHEVPDRVECTVEGVKTCSKCGSDDVGYKVIFRRPNNLIVRSVCSECGYSQSIPHVENLKKRTNTTLWHWREQVLKRDGYKCRICGSTEGLEAHHIIPVCNDRQMKYKYDINNGITLCQECHKLIPTG